MAAGPANVLGQDRRQKRPREDVAPHGLVSHSVRSSPPAGRSPLAGGGPSASKVILARRTPKSSPAPPRWTRCFLPTPARRPRPRPPWHPLRVLRLPGFRGPPDPPGPRRPDTQAPPVPELRAPDHHERAPPAIVPGIPRGPAGQPSAAADPWVLAAAVAGRALPSGRRIPLTRIGEDTLGALALPPAQTWRAWRGFLKGFRPAGRSGCPSASPFGGPCRFLELKRPSNPLRNRSRLHVWTV